MSLERLSETEWRQEFPSSFVQMNEVRIIEATPAGLSIDGDLITWEQLRVAMRIALLPPALSK